MDIEYLKQKYNYDRATPVMKQYLDVKFKHHECLVLFRMGDFYELFYDDAKLASRLLSIALTKRGKTEEEEIPMCGVPFHALENYIPKLLTEGSKVAICEQMETPEEAKKRDGSKAVIRREVSRIITPGTIFEDSLIEASDPNYLISISLDKKNASICYLDISTSEISVMNLPLSNLSSELSRLKPNEVLLSEKYRQSPISDFIGLHLDLLISFQVDSFFSPIKCEKVIQNFYKIASSDAIGELDTLDVSSIGAVLEYITVTQKENCPKLPLPKIELHEKYMAIDGGTLRNLEILSSSSGKKNSLRGIIDKTETPAGSRLFYKYLSKPLLDIDKINKRLDVVEFFHKNISLTEIIRSSLKSTGDLERCMARLNMNRGTPRDLISIKNTIKSAELIYDQIHKMIDEEEIPDYIKKLIAPLINNNEIFDLIDQAIVDEAPNSTNDGGIIKHSFNTKIKDLNDLIDNSRAHINSLKEKYKKITGVDSLKISHNNVIGLFIEVTIRHIGKMSDEIFIHRQSTANFARYTSLELKELETSLINAKQQTISLEKELYNEICEIIIKNNNHLERLSDALSHVDLYSSVAYLSGEYNYVRPTILEGESFEIIEGRHPIIEKTIQKGSGSFISNSCNLNSEERIWLITGPNMAGKSTFLRQNAIITILAQSGFFVPAQRASIGITDKIFSRIGAGDDLSRGQSTFMVEMLETAVILAQSTNKSLIILDEVGRGTSTFDGLAIAWSVLEYIHDKIRARCLFATHYHELTKMITALQAARCYTVAIDESSDNIVFLHKIIRGAADKSYGIHVARLAGLPDIVLKKAENLLKKLEKDNSKLQKEILKNQDVNLNLFEIDTEDSKGIKPKNNQDVNAEKYIHLEKDQKRYEKLCEKINSFELDKLSPRDALNALYEIRDSLELDDNIVRPSESLESK